VVTTAAVLIIGDEILSGKVRDTNAPLLIDLFRETGVELKRLVYLADDAESIAAEVRACSEAYDAVITSGGVGPTHDDCTIAAVADAFGVGVARHPEIEAMIRAYWGDRLNEAALRMAEMPEGSRLLFSSDGLLPLVVFRNVYLLPGVPRLFASKISALRSELDGEPPELRHLYLNSDESGVAPLLSQVDEEFPAVKIGSYPRLEAPDHRLWVTVEAASRELVDAAVERLLELLPDEEVVRTEP
jgi:molybdenum cofactor synthesis domain-containing protein